MVPPPREAEERVEAEASDPEVSEAEFMAASSRLLLKNTAPGLDGVPGRVLVLSLREGLEEQTRALFSKCLREGRFPRRWKSGKLVLIHKDGRPADSPSAYRPIVLLDEIGKLFERVLATRLVAHLGAVGPNLHEAQYGFRRGRSTVDAIAWVRTHTEEVVSTGGAVLAVSLDIANAFNALPWETIKEALRYHGVPRYLRKVIADYFVDRAILYPVRGGWSRWDVSCGVPQGSVLGPLLWNIGYDWVLRGPNPRGVDVCCYADDTLVLARGANVREATLLATTGVAEVVGRIRALGLEVALSKSEAMAFHGPRRAPPPGSEIVVDGTSIAVGPTMRYLGLVLDGRWRFTEHFRRLALKLVACAGALGRVLPNIGGPGGNCRRLYIGVVRSMALYGAPIWAEDLNVANRAELRRPQRVIACRAARAYRTVSFEASAILSGSPPWDLEAGVLAAIYRRCAEARARGFLPPPEDIRRWRERAHDRLFRRWKERLAIPAASHDLVAAFRPVIRDWAERRRGALTFHLTQLLTGHGCFGRYLCRVARREPTMECHHCGAAEDTAHHTCAVCPAWSSERATLISTIGADLSLPSVVRAMVDSEQAWEAVLTFAGAVMSRKEAAERTRENNPLAPLIRRARRGRRRRAYADRLPP